LTERVSRLEGTAGSPSHGGGSAEGFSDHEEQIKILNSRLSDLKSNLSRLENHCTESVTEIRGLIEELRMQRGDSGSGASAGAAEAKIVSLDDFEIREQIGSDEYSEYFMGHEKRTGRKVQLRRWREAGGDDTASFVRWISIQSQLSSSGVSRLLCSGYTPGDAGSGLIVEEFAEFGCFDQIREPAWRGLCRAE
jgi:hypothetical protein